MVAGFFELFDHGGVLAAADADRAGEGRDGGEAGLAGVAPVASAKPSGKRSED